MTFTLRRHMVNLHGLTPSQVSRITNKRGPAGVPAGAAGGRVGDWDGAEAAAPAEVRQELYGDGSVV